MVHGIMRVLLITPPASSADSSSACDEDASEWIGLATSLRGAGLQVEVLDAAALGRDLEAVEVHVEHCWLVTPRCAVTRPGGISSAKPSLGTGAVLSGRLERGWPPEARGLLTAQEWRSYAAPSR